MLAQRGVEQLHVAGCVLDRAGQRLPHPLDDDLLIDLGLLEDERVQRGVQLSEIVDQPR